MLRSLWSTRLPNPRRPGALWWAWSGLALLFVLLAPAQLWDGTFVGSLPARGLTEALAGGAAFIAHTLWLRARTAGAGGMSVAGALAAGIACYGAAYGLLAFFWPDVAYSRGQFAVAGGGGIVLALLPHVFAPVLRVSVVAALGGAVGVVLALGVRPALTGAPARVFLSTALRPIERIASESPVAPVRKVRGGAIEPLDSSLVVITNDGDFY